MLFPLALAAGVGLADYFSTDIQLKCGRVLHKVTSVTSGVAVAYIFLHLLPEFVEGVNALNKFIFLTALGGFVAVYLIEKYIYQHSPIKKLKQELAVEDSSILFLYNFVVGALLVEFALGSSLEAVLLFVPVFLHSAMSGLPLDISVNRMVRGISSAAALIGAGVIIAAGALSPAVKFSLIGILTGALIFSVTRHHLAFGRQGSPSWFLAGAGAYSAIIVAIWVSQGGV